METLKSQFEQARAAYLDAWHRAESRAEIDKAEAGMLALRRELERMETLKPGTRCGCRTPDCIGNCGHGQQISGRNQPARQCHRDAVRLVTVRHGDSVLVGGTFRRTDVGKIEVPMCAACAEFHERGGK